MHARIDAQAAEPAMTMPMSVTAERTQWATRISAAWQKSVDSIIETGRLLLAAKAGPKMQRGEWERWSRAIYPSTDIPRTS
jgi:hypothetical protein